MTRSKIARLAFAGLALLPVAPGAAAAQDAAACALQPNILTHSKPPYPPISWRLSEQGSTLISVGVNTEGNVTECSVVNGSGSERLDTASCDWIKSHWRWQPPAEGCEPVKPHAIIVVEWNIANPPGSKTELDMRKTDYPPGAEIITVTVPRIDQVE